jgi:hypothetical protein
VQRDQECPRLAVAGDQLALELDLAGGPGGGAQPGRRRVAMPLMDEFRPMYVDVPGGLSGKCAPGRIEMHDMAIVVDHARRRVQQISCGDGVAQASPGSEFNISCAHRTSVMHSTHRAPGMHAVAS